MTAVKQKDRPAHQQQHQVKPHHRDTTDSGNFSDFIDPFDGNKGHHDHPAGRQNTDRLRRRQATQRPGLGFVRAKQKSRERDPDLSGGTHHPHYVRGKPHKGTNEGKARPDAVVHPGIDPALFATIS